MVSVKEQLIKEIQALPEAHAKQVADYLAFLKYQEREAARQLNGADETALTTLQTEFANEDRQLAEAAGVGYLADLTLEEMLAGITDENRHEEIDFGPPVGKEVW